MKKALLTAITVLVLQGSLVSGLQIVGLANANPVAIPSLWISCPNQYNSTFTVDSVPLIVHLNVANWSNDLQSTQIKYSIDGTANVSFSGLKKFQVYEHPAGSSWVIEANTTLTNLSEGNHSITVYAKTATNDNLSESITFTVNTNDSPNPTTTPLSTPSPTPKQEPNPKSDSSQTRNYTIPAAVDLAILAVAVSTLVYFALKKTKEQL